MGASQTFHYYEEMHFYLNIPQTQWWTTV